MPKSTLADAVAGKTIIGKKSGRKLLTDEEEERVSGWIAMQYKLGKEVRMREACQTVKIMLDKAGRKLPMHDNNMPGKDWWWGFLRRHPGIVEIRKKRGNKYLTDEEEQRLVDWTLIQHHVCLKVKSILDEVGRQLIMHEDNTPKRKPLSGFALLYE